MDFSDIRRYPPEAFPGFIVFRPNSQDKPHLIRVLSSIQILRADPELTRTKIIAVTGYGKDEDRRRSKAAGMDHHLTKPVNPDDLDQLMRVLARTG